MLKELVQNADDAGATTIRFVYDTRKHPTDNLAEDNLAQFQAPSILIHNNAMFTESDFASIQSIGSSISKKDKVNKTGRFGLGFNAVYHISELPAFCSSEYLIYFDPQCKYLPNINPGNPGKRINFVKQQIIKKYPNQFYPFKMFDNDMLTKFNGTLFRLPLRTKEQSNKSQLSSKYYTDDDMKLMYNSLINEGDNFLLFLKSIKNLEYYCWSDMNATEPALLYRVKIADKLSRQQHELRNYITTIQKPNASLSWIRCNKFKFETILFEKNSTKTKAYFSEWIICNALGGGSGQCSQIAANPQNKHLKLLPYGGIAARIYSNVPWQIQDDDEEKEVSKKRKQNAIIRPKGSLIGRAYCFLSLPLKNGLPVHCNGYFELSSNRRDLWWGSGDDMTGSGSLRYFWNMTLIQDVITRCYIEVINFAKSMVIDQKINMNTFYNLWPYQVPGNEGDPFEILTTEILTIISNQFSFLYSKQNGGQWLKCANSVISADSANQTSSSQNIKEDKQISSVLLDIGLPIVELPSYQLNVLQKASRPPTTLSSRMLCVCITRYPRTFCVVLYRICSRLAAAENNGNIDDTKENKRRYTWCRQWIKQGSSALTD